MRPWDTRPFNREELAATRARLEGMSDAQLQRFYVAAHKMCALERGKGPGATYIQQLVTAWRVLKKRGMPGN